MLGGPASRAGAAGAAPRRSGRPGRGAGWSARRDARLLRRLGPLLLQLPSSFHCTVGGRESCLLASVQGKGDQRLVMQGEVGPKP